MRTKLKNYIEYRNNLYHIEYYLLNENERTNDDSVVVLENLHRR